MKLSDHQPNIQELRKISSLFTTGDLDIDNLTSQAMDTAAEKAVERAIVLSEKEELSKDAFEFEVHQPSFEISTGQSLKEANDFFHRTYIIQTLKTTGGNRTKAAKILQAQRSYL